MHYSRTRIKICGITRVEDALAAAELGVDAIGLVFYPSSSRNVTLEQAREISAALPAFVSVTGLFVDAEVEQVRRVCDAVPLDVLQFHGSESAAYCGAFARPYIKALKVRLGLDVAGAIAQYSGAGAVLLDAWHKDLAGGTGDRFDWSLVPEEHGKVPLVLAGGLDSGNVAEAIEMLHPYAVDVSSGVEAAPGVKSGEKLKRFVNAVNQVRG